MIINMLKNWNGRYSSHYIIKFIDFIMIYHVILTWILFHSLWFLANVSPVLRGFIQFTNCLSVNTAK